MTTRYATGDGSLSDSIWNTQADGGGDTEPVENGDTLESNGHAISLGPIFPIGNLTLLATDGGSYAITFPIVPDVQDVRFGVVVNEAGTFGNMTMPAATDLRSGESCGTDGTEIVGTLTLPDEEDVLTGVQYGGDGSEFIGELSAGGGVFPVLGNAIIQPVSS